MQGYFRKRGSTWSFSIDIGRDPETGKRKQKTVSGFTTKKEAQAAAAAMLQELTQGSYIVEKDILLEVFVPEWIKQYQHSVKVSTVRVRQHESSKLVEHFKGYQVKQISRKLYQDFLINLHIEGFAPNTISGIHSTCKMIFAKAVELEVIKNDPTQYAKPPRTQKTVDDIEKQDQQFKYLEKEELSLFLRTAKEHGLERDYAIFLTLAYSDTYYDHDFVFAKTEQNKGYPELIKTIHNRMRRLLRLAGLNEKLSPHSLRHTHVSLLAEAGADIFQIIERMGHSSDEQIRTVYLHVTKTMKKEASQKFSELMKNL